MAVRAAGSEQAFEGGLRCARLPGPPACCQILLRVVPGSVVPLAAFPLSQNSAAEPGRSSPSVRGPGPSAGPPTRLCSKLSGSDVRAAGPGISSVACSLSPSAAPTKPTAPPGRGLPSLCLVLSLRAERRVQPHARCRRSSSSEGECRRPDSARLISPLPRPSVMQLESPFLKLVLGFPSPVLSKPDSVPAQQLKTARFQGRRRWGGARGRGAGARVHRTGGRPAGPPAGQGAQRAWGQERRADRYRVARLYVSGRTHCCRHPPKVSC